MQRLENELAVIERLAAADPRLNVDSLENSLMSSIALTSRLGESSASLIDPGDIEFGSGSNMAPVGSAPLLSFSSSTDVSPAAVPEPSTVLLAATAALGFVLAAHRRRSGH